MRSLALLGGAMWLASVGTAAAQAPPAAPAQPAPAAVVSRDDAEVRAGPNENPQLYVTNRLQRGTAVEVVEELGNGWLKIRPPAGSFSWINTRFVEQVAPNQPNWMVISHPDVRVPVIVGTDFKKEVTSQIEGCRLARGAQVTSHGPARVDDEGTWLPIDPPAGEFRYIRAADVARNGVTPPAPAPTTSSAGPAGAPPVPPLPATATEAEALWMRARQAEVSGFTAEAVDLYGRTAAAAQANNPELARQARDRADWLSKKVAAAPHSTFTPAPLPPGDIRLTAMPAAPPNVQLAGPVAVQTTTSYPQPPAAPGVTATGPGRLRRAGRCLEGRTTYVLESAQGRPMYYVTPEQGVDLEPHVNHIVELFGTAAYSGELRANYMRAGRVQAAAP
jgi:SH3-like domain-containing protein